jgi:hypothetical protein
MPALDTNVLVRYIVQDDPSHLAATEIYGQETSQSIGPVRPDSEHEHPADAPRDQQDYDKPQPQ